MAGMATPHSDDRLHHSLSEITRLLDRHRVLEALAHQQDSPRRDLVEQLQHRQNVAEWFKRHEALTSNPWDRRRTCDATGGTSPLCAKPRYRYDNSAFTLGGPVLIPGHDVQREAG